MKRLLPLLLVLAGAGCASSARVTEPAPPRPAPPAYAVPREEAPPPAAEARLDERLRALTAEWDGTPHRLGGRGREGLDCSAFTQIAYADLFDVPLPRTTEEQAGTGVPVSPRALRAGDLVFFRPAPKTRHVGIYLSEGEFAHVSSSRGVTISRLDQPYWRDAYWTARRILDAPAAPEHASPAPAFTEMPASTRPLRTDPAPPPAPRRRTGW